MDGTQEAKLILQRLVGRFALLVVFVYVLVVFGGFVRLSQGDTVSALTWLMLVPAGLALVPAAIDAINLHRTSDQDRLRRLWRRCALLMIGGLALLVIAAIVLDGAGQ